MRQIPKMTIEHLLRNLQLQLAGQDDTITLNIGRAYAEQLEEDIRDAIAVRLVHRSRS